MHRSKGITVRRLGGGYAGRARKGDEVQLIGVPYLFLVFAFAASAFAVPAVDIFRENFGVDRIVAVAAFMGGFCAVTFQGSLSLTVTGIIGSVASVLAFSAVGMYCGAFAAPLIAAVFGGTVGAAAPAPSAFLVAWGAPFIYMRLKAWRNKEDK